MGYFVSEDGVEKILEFRRSLFLQNEVPVLFRNMYLLNVTTEDVAKRFEQFIEENCKEIKLRN